ncbi:hypothetical protein JAAARDRAFT_192081 [Jaapia argillacea MUCL 33604]|uniref:C3H1-type domain-containing protein n=1 Tax=Jaapia argillacea MUCL 33604 TaxID=933084 RepID=A0A067Q098_9AGAM|nr:hypothetical protein JAAARDRAFT_192081 [Jaapia argillacea MUCL 33604]
MSVDQAWADRTACREYVSIYTSVGDERRRRLIDPRTITGSRIYGCGRRWCEYSHTLLDTSRLRLLVGDIDTISTSTKETLVTLEYVGGFEIFGHSEAWNYGWKVTLYAGEAQGTLQRYTEPLVCMDEDVNVAISKLVGVLRSRGYSMPSIDEEDPMGRRMTICNHYIKGNCGQGTHCSFNHDLFDLLQIARLVDYPAWYLGAIPFFTLRLDYLTTGSSSWRMTLHARSASGELRQLPLPVSCENPNIHTAMLSVESLAEFESQYSVTSRPNYASSETLRQLKATPEPSFPGWEHDHYLFVLNEPGHEYYDRVWDLLRELEERRRELNVSPAPFAKWELEYYLFVMIAGKNHVAFDHVGELLRGRWDLYSTPQPSHPPLPPPPPPPPPLPPRPSSKSQGEGWSWLGVAAVAAGAAIVLTLLERGRG